jgi:hypothetical protein
MPKYYVDAGDLRKVIDRPDPKTAAIDSFRTLEDNPVSSLNSVTIVSEEGFDADNENDWCFTTVEILEQSDQIGYYKSEE